MSWKGAARSFAATTRRIERDQQRRARVATQQFKQLQKEQAITSAAQAVAGYNDYLGVIKSIHHDCSDELNWSAMQHERPPVAPAPGTGHEQAAQAALDAYKPGLFDRLFKRGPGKIQRLQEALVDARRHDQQLNTERQAEHARQLTEWQERQDLPARCWPKTRMCTRRYWRFSPLSKASTTWGPTSNSPSPPTTLKLTCT